MAPLPEKALFCPGCGKEASNDDQAKRMRKADEFQEVIDAINRNTNTKVGEVNTSLVALQGEVGGLKTEISGLNDQVGGLKTRVEEANKRVDKHDVMLENLQGEIRMLKERGVGQVIQASSGHEQRTSVPRNCRWSLVIGNFEFDTEKEEIEKKLKEMTSDREENVQEFFCPSKRFLQDHKGNRFRFDDRTLWHSTDLIRDERVLGKKSSRAIQFVRENLVSAGKCDDNQAKRYVDGVYHEGKVTYRKEGKGKAHLIYTKKEDVLDLTLGPDAVAVDVGFDLATYLPQVKGSES